MNKRKEITNWCPWALDKEANIGTISFMYLKR